MNYEDMIDGYNDLRDKCLEIALKNNAELMGEFAWLRFAITADDITLGFIHDEVVCYGSTYTNQTMAHEYFEFRLPPSIIEGE
jgi:hypothetical protein